MSAKTVKLSVPAEPEFARVVRMTAANLTVCCEMSIDDVEDARMAAEEGFVYACASGIDVCDVEFTIDGPEVTMAFSLGDKLEEAEDVESLDLVEALLAAICDDSYITEDDSRLVLVKRIGDAHGE